MAPTSTMHDRGYAPAQRGQCSTCENVGELERIASAIAGGGLAAVGLARGSAGGAAMALIGASLLYRGLSGNCKLYEALGIDTSDGPRRAAIPAQQGNRIEESITINRPQQDLFRFWRDFENLAQFMEHLESVKTDGDRSHWAAKGPLGMTVEWDAEIINERENELIAWRSLKGSEVDTAGSVHFEEASGGRGTVVTVNLKYNPPGGKLGAGIAKLFGEDPKLQIREDLQRLKRLMESGEVRSSESQPSARRAK